jgi:hypothetical protein
MGTTSSDANIGAKAVVEKFAVLKRVSGVDRACDAAASADEVIVFCCGASGRDWHKADKSSRLLFVRFRG